MLRNGQKTMTLQWKLAIAFAFTTGILFIIHFTMYSNIDRMVEQVDHIYVSNVMINELSIALNHVQESMTEYLNTKSSESMEDYYRSIQDYGVLSGQLNYEVTDNRMLLYEKNIRGMSNAYLTLTKDTVQAKRGRNVEKYKEIYETATTLYHDINVFINNLNNEKFKKNTSKYNDLTSSIQYMEIMSSDILIVAAVANIILIILLTKTITKPLNRLAKAANEVAKGNLSSKVEEVTTTDEVGIVSRAFNQMLDSIETYIEQVKRNMEREQQLKEKELLMESHLKDAQLKYLQAQINPHFLFNSLNAGVQLAMMEDAEETGSFIEKMADFFRYTIKSMEREVTIAEELHVIDSYIYILNVRFRGEIHYTKKVEEQLLQKKVPSMILQPIVENAVNHGLREIERPGEIQVQVYRQENTMCIQVSDNGVGMSQEKIASIYSRDTVISQSTGIGLINVIERLTLYYGKKDLLWITSEVQRGTDIMIIIPIMEE